MNNRNRYIFTICVFILFISKVEALQLDSLQTTLADSLKKDSIWRSLQLQEITVKGSNVRHHPNKDVWTITSDMRKNTVNTYELLERIPGFFLNHINKEISFKGKSDVLIIVDGKEKDADYIGSLNNLRFKKIEVYDNTYTRFPNKVVINLITKEEWQGYDFTNDASTLMLPSSPYGNFFSRANESASFTFTRPKYDLSTGLRYNHTNSSVAENRELRQGSQYSYHLLKNGANMTQYYNTFTCWIDYDYRLSKNHVFSAKYAYSSKSQDTHYHHLYEKKNLLLQSTTLLDRNIFRENGFNQHALNFYYRGNLNSWQLYSDIGINIYNDQTLYSLSENTGFATENRYHDKRNVWTMNIDATKKFANGNSLNIALSHVNRYYSGKDQIEGLFETNKYRNDRFALNYQCILSRCFSGSVIGSYENTYVSSNAGNFHQDIFAGGALLNYLTSDKKTNGELRFYTMLRPPTYSQILPFTNIVDSMTTITGNPLLKSEVTYASNVRISRGSFYTSLDFQYSGNKISMEYAWEDGMIKGQYQNVNYSSWIWSAGVQFPDLKWKKNSLKFRAHMEYHNRHMWHGSNSQSQSGWKGFADLTCALDKVGTFQLQYATWPRYDIFTQGKGRSFNDWWQLSVWKYLIKNRLYIRFDYNLPIRLGINKSSYQEIKTPFYTDYRNTCYYEKNRNSIDLTVQFRLFKGHKVNKKNNRQSNAVIQDEFTE